ncbi:MAG TPA: glycoside hydrolase family 3 N-terminal domain-containing protein [Thermoanaerobaculia bacterium]|nr:glycoside hydrolase family 3 N-terminal domain-containing protein [Thermoanaerobaculia bacterium]
MRRISPTAAVLLASLLAGCGANPFPAQTVDFGQLQPEPPRALSMPLADKVGQLFVVQANGVFMSEDSEPFQTLRHHVVDNRIGGVMLSRSSVYGAAVLVQKLQEMARTPLLVSADLEAGSGMRFEDTTYGPWAMAIAATGDPSLAERRGRATAEEARAIGVAQVYAPVADVNVNPDNPVINVRSFGEDPSDVARYVVATVHGLQAGQVLATLKHFPGHGDAATDSHRSLVTIPGDRARLESVELVPFRAGIKAGAESVMIAHVSVPSWDATPAPILAHPVKPADVIGETFEIEKGPVPATVSAPIVTGILRKELGFTGLVVTDAMRMGGITSHYEPGEAAILAILAGSDQILLSSDTDAAIKAVMAAVKSGRISEARIDESVKRILDAKKRLNLYDKGSPFVGKISKIVGTQAHVDLEAEIARRSMTLVREKAGALPFRRDAKILSLVVADEPTLYGPAGTLDKELKTRVPGLKSVRLDTRSTPEEARAAADAAKDADAVLLSLFVRARSGQGRFVIPDAARSVIPALLASGKPVVAVAFGSPYLLRDFPDLPTYLCAWGSQDVVQVAAAKALFGEATIDGRLPITIPGLAKRGDGISKPVLPR